MDERELRPNQERLTAMHKKSYFIREVLSAYGIKPNEVTTEVKPSCRCLYCGGNWNMCIPGTVNGNPVYKATCPVCGLSSKDFDSLLDLLAYLKQE